MHVEFKDSGAFYFFRIGRSRLLYRKRNRDRLFFARVRCQLIEMAKYNHLRGFTGQELRNERTHFIYTAFDLSTSF